MSEDTDRPYRSGFVAIVGWTNVGKSTLLNRLLGEKLAAVADVPQTTRTRITGALHLPDRGQIAFVDTPGLHRPRHRLNRAMIETAQATIGTVDLVLLVVDAERGPGPGDEETTGLVRRVGVPVLGVLNKVDRVEPKSRLLPMLQTLHGWGVPETIPISARTGDGCDVLLDRVVALLPQGPPLFAEDFLTDQPERALAAEWIREKLLQLTREEVPHATAVVVDRWEERGDGLLEIDATILVEREGQKAIVIGKGGQLLKQVGIEARRDLERFFESRVMLRLWVKVRADWRDDERTLHELGIS